MKKENKPKRKLNIRRILIFFLLVYLLYTLVTYGLKMPIKHIYITGNNNVYDHEIIEMAKIKDYPAIQSINTKKLEKIIKKNPLIKTVTIKKRMLGVLEITIKENKPLYINKSNNLVGLDNNLEVDLYKSLPLPILINYIPDKVKLEFVNNFNKVDEAIITSINSIEYKPERNEKGEVIDDKTFEFVMNDGNKVVSNPLRMENFNYYFEMLTAIESRYEGKKGTIYLDSADPETFPFILHGEKNEE